MRGNRSAAAFATLVAALACVPSALGVAPANDNFANAEALADDSVVRSTAEATKEVGEPDHAGNVGGASIWFRWSSNAEGLVSFDTFGAHFDTLLAVYTGGGLDDLQEVAANDDWSGQQSRVGFFAQTGQEYWLAVDGKNGATGWVWLRRHAAQRPPNDPFSAPDVLSGESGSTSSISNFLATEEPGEPDHAGVRGGASLWYLWTAPRNGVVEFDTCGAVFDTVLAAYRGQTLAGLTEIASDDDVGCGPQSAIAFRVEQGNEYRLAVDSADGETGYPRLMWHMRPANDDFADAQAITGSSGNVHLFTYSATHETGEPYHAAASGTGSVWYRWTTPTTIPIRFETCSSTWFDSLLAVYTGGAVGSLTEVASSDDDCGLGSAVEFLSSAGATYSVAVDGFDVQGSFDLEWSVPAPRNDGPPRITGAAVEEGDLVADPGLWRFGDSFSYLWRSCPAASTSLTVECFPLRVPNVQRITVPSRAFGTRIGVYVVATGPGGALQVGSGLTEPVGYRPPRNRNVPTILGFGEVGSTLASSEGSWDLGRATRIDLTYLWEQCDRLGANCRAVKGPGSDALYRLTSADLGRRIRVVVTLTSTGGATTAASTPTEVILAFERAATKPLSLACVVPRLVGKTLRVARAALVRSRCRLGTVRRAYSARKAGRIVRQRPAAGKRLRAGARVNVFVSKGRRR